MKNVSQILLAVCGIPFVLFMLGTAALRRLMRGPYLAGSNIVAEYSQVNWDEVWQRPQQYAWLASISRPVVYCCPVQLHNLQFLGSKWKNVRRFTDGRDLVVLSPLIFSGHFKWNIVYKINCLITAMYLKLALGPNVLVRALINTPFGIPVIDHCFYNGDKRTKNLEKLVYDVIDDFTVFDWSPAFGKALDDKLMRDADTVITGTYELAKLRPGAEFIPCGVDFDLFSKKNPTPNDLTALPRPLIGYFGTISERIDLEIIAQLADHFPAGSIVLVGPVHLPDHMLPRRPNIHYLGLRRHSEIPAYAQAFDVGLIPFRITAATIKLNPVKTLEYLAAGLPVVATRLPDLEHFYSDLIDIANDRDAFVAAVEQATTSPNPARIARGMETAKQASWHGMTEKINKALLADRNPTV